MVRRHSGNAGSGEASADAQSIRIEQVKSETLKINRIALAAETGNATPDEVSGLMSLFCQSVEQGHVVARHPVGQAVLDYVVAVCQRYLQPEMSAERALGVRKGRGAPANANEDRDIEIAASVLALRLQGISLGSATKQVGREYGKTAETVRGAVRKHPLWGAAALIQRRVASGTPLSEQERGKLQGLIAAEESRTGPELSLILSQLHKALGK